MHDGWCSRGSTTRACVRLKYGIYALLILSILAVLGAGHSKPKARQRAISLPFFSFQASELGKVLLILALASLIVDRARRLRERDTTARVMLAALVPAVLRDRPAGPRVGDGLHGGRVRACCSWRGRSWQPAGWAAGARCARRSTIVLVAAPAVGVHVLKPYQAERLTAFLHPSSNFAGNQGKGIKDR